MDQARTGPPARIRIVGRALNGAITRAPWLWPVLRAPMRRYFDDLAVGWDERTAAGSAEHLTAVAAAIDHIDVRPERILDLGTGTGAVALFLAREYPTARVRGVDLSEEMIRDAKAKVGLDPEGRIAFKVADAAALPYDDASFDLITQVNVPPFFTEIARVLRPGGHVAIAASIGSDTPFYTPQAVLERGLRRRGVEPVASGSAGEGTYVVGRKAGGSR